MMPILSMVLGALLGTGAVLAEETPPYDAELRAILAQAQESHYVQAGTLPPGNRELFERVIGTEAVFQHAAVGPFDLYVYLDGDLAEPLEAARVRSQASSGMQRLADVVESRFERGNGLISGRRFPIVMTSDVGGTGAFDRLIALLDWCEADYTGYVSVNGTYWTPKQRAQICVRNWEVQLIDLSNDDALATKERFLEHGIGYFTLEHLVKRMLTYGTWGNPPPWVAKGLVDELDIEAYGEAWIGHDFYTRQTPGWYREGWSGFVPAGSSPPPMVRGPPADLAVTVEKSGDPWGHRANSPERHWKELAEDRKSEAPASFLFMAKNESFMPRDRALARCAFHLLLDMGRTSDGETDLLVALDHDPVYPPNGMPDSEPITVVFANSLGGVEEVERLEGLTTAELLEELAGDDELSSRSEEMGPKQLPGLLKERDAEALLAMNDHREMAEWLYTQAEYDLEARQEIWNLILAIEYFQQLKEWEALGTHLDEAVDAALKTSPTYPARSASRKRASKAFMKELAG